jgi:hypothetical protein
VKPALRIKPKGEASLSGESLTTLMRAVLAKGKPFRFRAKGFSMSPFIKDGDVVTIRPLSAGEPRTGDVAAFLFPSTGRVALHRVVAAGDGLFHLKGDNVPEGDGAVAADRILGVVARVERNGETVRLGRGLGDTAIARLSRTGVLGRAVGAARRLSGLGKGRG